MLSSAFSDSIYVLVVSCIFAGLGQNIQTQHGTLLSAFNNLVSFESVLSAVTGLSKIQCAALCLQDVKCYSFHYQDMTRRCQLQPTVLNIYTTNTVTLYGSRYYRVAKVSAHRCPELAQQLNYSYEPTIDVCYKLYADKIPWHDASNQCSGDGGHLLVVSDISTNDWLFSLINEINEDFVWFDGTDAVIENDFRNYKNQSLSFKFFGGGEPNDVGGNENCLSLYISEFNNTWVDYDCGKTALFVCQIDF